MPDQWKLEIAPVRNNPLSEDELISTVILLLVAGHETTRSLIGGGVLALLRHPGQLAVLRERPELTGQAVEELLRYDPPVQLVIRYALPDAQLAGIAIPAESFVLLLAGAANRDETVFRDPDRFEVLRDTPSPRGVRPVRSRDGVP